MEETAQAQLHGETETWLNRGRQSLLEQLLDRFVQGDGKELLEIGAGAGQNLTSLVKYGVVDAIEVSESALLLLREKAEIRNLIQTVVPAPEIDRRYDVICALDVIEHMENDRAGLEWMADHLFPGGRLIITAPAYPWLFSEHDRANHHYRRYTRNSMIAALPPEFSVLTAGYFNTLLFPAAVLGRGFWQLKRRMTASGDNIGAKQSSKLPPLLDSVFFSILNFEARVIGAGIEPPAGLSIFCVAAKT